MVLGPLQYLFEVFAIMSFQSFSSSYVYISTYTHAVHFVPHHV